MVDSNKMNELIKAYYGIREKVDEIGKFSFDLKKNQTEQTSDFISKLGISL